MHLGPTDPGDGRHGRRRVVRDAVIAAEIGAAAFVVVSGVEAVVGSGTAQQPPTVTQVVEAPPGMTATIDVVDGSFAVNEGLRSAQSLMEQKMGGMMGGLGLPGLPGL